MPNTEIFLPEKDLRAMQHPDDSAVRPQDPDSSKPDQNISKNHIERFQNKQDDPEQKQQDFRQRKRRCAVLSGLEIPAPVRISPPGEYSDESREGFKTPTGSDLRRGSEVVVAVKNPSGFCPPPAPRKPKAAPATKRRAVWIRSSVILLDVSREVESMFPPSVLDDFGKKIKRARS